ncbi:hypothetical protein B0H14DRAFT_2579457 [Mycena olivaceomarginata]|nr:hypothetical protein B0H14DRAFT_2579457 [Mycena olivaceomarginata]
MHQGYGCPCAIRRRSQNQSPSPLHLPRRQARKTSTLLLSALRPEHTRANAPSACARTSYGAILLLAHRRIQGVDAQNGLERCPPWSESRAECALGCRYRGRSGRRGRIGKEINASEKRRCPIRVILERDCGKIQPKYTYQSTRDVILKSYSLSSVLWHDAPSQVFICRVDDSRFPLGPKDGSELTIILLKFSSRTVGDIYTMATFNKADWVAQGNKYQNIPPHVKRACGAAGTAALPAGFACNSSGDLERSGAAEDTELDVNPADLPLATRRAKRNAKAPSRYGGEDMWDQAV